jgi:mRNA-degrading endonuclease RelE of RelBE toxin-antitoxin system
MEVFFRKSFTKDICKITDDKLKARLKELITQLDNIENLNKLTGLKKIKGSTNAFRLRIGDYRVGFYQIENQIHLSRFLKRNDIYKLFP